MWCGVDICVVAWCMFLLCNVYVVRWNHNEEEWILDIKDTLCELLPFDCVVNVIVTTFLYAGFLRFCFPLLFCEIVVKSSKLGPNKCVASSEFLITKCGYNHFPFLCVCNSFWSLIKSSKVKTYKRCFQSFPFSNVKCTKEKNF